MKIRLLTFSLVFFMVLLLAPSQLKKLDRKYRVQYNHIQNRLSLAAKNQLTSLAKQFKSRMIPLDRQKNPGGVLEGIFSSAVLSNKDASEAAFIVMMMAIKDIEDDIHKIIAEIKAMNEVKQKYRDWIKQINQLISELNAGHRDDTRHINNQPVSGSSTRGRDLRLRCLKAYTPNYRVAYCRALPVKPIPRLTRLNRSQLLRARQLKYGELKYLDGLMQDVSSTLKMLLNCRANFLASLTNISRRI
jgi:hypothetical protein